VPDKILRGFNRLMEWGRHNDLVPAAQVIGMSRDDPELVVFRGLFIHHDVSLFLGARK
jgi:DNA gyrase inhibitor GyrI